VSIKHYAAVYEVLLCNTILFLKSCIEQAEKVVNNDDIFILFTSNAAISNIFLLGVYWKNWRTNCRNVSYMVWLGN
jgi:hypothetical protein